MQDASPISFVLSMRVTGVVVTTIIMISSAVKVVSVIEVVIIIVRELIRACVASIIAPIEIISSVPTCLRIVMLINSQVEAVAVRVQVVVVVLIVIAASPEILISVLVVGFTLEILVFIVVLGIWARLRHLLHAFLNNCNEALEYCTTFSVSFFACLFLHLRLTLHQPMHIAMPCLLKPNHKGKLINKLKCTSYFALVDGLLVHLQTAKK